MIPDELLAADLDQLFADWSREVTLRAVTETYDPATAQTTEQFTDTPLTAVTSASREEPTPLTARQHSTGELSILVKRADLPDPVPAHAYFLIDGVEFDVVSSSLSVQSLVHEFNLRRQT